MLYCTVKKEKLCSGLYCCTGGTAVLWTAPGTVRSHNGLSGQGVNTPQDFSPPFSPPFSSPFASPFSPPFSPHLSTPFYPPFSPPFCPPSSPLPPRPPFQMPGHVPEGLRRGRRSTHGDPEEGEDSAGQPGQQGTGNILSLHCPSPPALTCTLPPLFCYPCILSAPSLPS